MKKNPVLDRFMQQINDNRKIRRILFLLTGSRRRIFPGVTRNRLEAKRFYDRNGSPELKKK